MRSFGFHTSARMKPIIVRLYLWYSTVWYRKKSVCNQSSRIYCTYVDISIQNKKNFNLFFLTSSISSVTHSHGGRHLFLPFLEKDISHQYPQRIFRLPLTLKALFSYQFLFPKFQIQQIKLNLPNTFLPFPSILLIGILVLYTTCYIVSDIRHIKFKHIRM